MRVDRVVSPPPVAPFPIYSDMVGDLLALNSGTTRNAMVAHVLATCASYCYADLDTVSLIMTRLGMDGCGCVRVQQSVDAMYIFSTAYVLQSRCGRVVILCYRGTEPTNLGSWLGDADAGTERLMSGSTRSEALAVHRGFYRNFRATHWQVLQELALASNARQLGNPDEKVDYPLEALYVTGHSLGGAMAVLFALTTNSERLRAVYTFGQPMVVASALSWSPQVADSKIVRHVLPGDPVPALPPAAWGAYAHIGREYRYSAGEWTLSLEATPPMPSLREIPRSVLALFSAGSHRKSTRKTVRYAIDAHPPHRYLDLLRPPGRLTEFGD